MPWNATFVPVSCYFHMKSRVFYSQAYIFNTREFKLRCVFVEAAQCKSFHLRRSNKLEKCYEREGGCNSVRAEAGVHTQAGRISRTDWGRWQTSYENALGTMGHQHGMNSVVGRTGSLPCKQVLEWPPCFLRVSLVTARALWLLLGAFLHQNASQEEKS